MLTFPMPVAGLAPRQLAHQLRAIVTLGDDDISVNAGLVEIRAPQSAAVAIAAIVAAHIPDPDYFEDERDRRSARAIAKARVDALAGIRAQDLTAAQVRDLVLALAVKAGALTRTGALKPWDMWDTVG